MNRTKKVAILTCAVFALLCSGAFTSTAEAVLIFKESFENAGPNNDSGSAGQATVLISPAAFSGDGGIFDRTDSANGSSPAGADGDFYWRAAPEQLNTHSITFDDINIANHEDLVFTMMAAAGNGAPRFDPADVLEVTYSVDGGPVRSGLCFNSVGGVAAGDDQPIAHDANCDGDGTGGAQLSEDFRLFVFSVSEGNSLDLTVTTVLDGDDEQLFFDDFQLNGRLVPEPSGLVGMGLCCTVALWRSVRRRKTKAA